ncbi:hypothetical protein RM553_18830 [Zunongwangia sp. F363]|uniref:Uncharacterized protein n=1 Tax=Autumnicola tepida TaxID=3075595 RepID=A0ABU3CEX2_9FLAO|nr:hypothetical protein [Zunongwangia sp. F363]MDT0644900.1 hypothetical protein [Zunongwangia sp. F363]
MASLIFCHRILRLSYSNLNLLKMYYTMVDTRPEERMLEDVVIKNRIGIRECIKQELNKWQENCPDFQKWPLYLQEPLIAVEYNLSFWLRKNNYDNCYNCELANVNLYYDCLYVSSNSKATNDLLLAQKDCIERYLIAEI